MRCPTIAARRSPASIASAVRSAPRHGPPRPQPQTRRRWSVSSGGWCRESYAAQCDHHARPNIIPQRQRAKARTIRAQRFSYGRRRRNNGASWMGLRGRVEIVSLVRMRSMPSASAASAGVQPSNGAPRRSPWAFRHTAWRRQSPLCPAPTPSLKSSRQTYRGLQLRAQFYIRR